MFNHLSINEISETEFKSRRGSEVNQELRTEMKRLRIGEGLEVERSKWAGTKLGPGVMVGNFSRKLNGSKKFTCRTKLDESGWVVMRIK